MPRAAFNKFKCERRLKSHYRMPLFHAGGSAPRVQGCIKVLVTKIGALSKQFLVGNFGRWFGLFGSSDKILIQRQIMRLGNFQFWFIISTLWILVIGKGNQNSSLKLLHTSP